MSSNVPYLGAELNLLLKESEDCMKLRGFMGDSFDVLAPERENVNFLIGLTDGTLGFCVEITIASRPPKSLEFRRCQPNLH